MLTQFPIYVYSIRLRIFDIDTVAYIHPSSSIVALV